MSVCPNCGSLVLEETLTVSTVEHIFHGVKTVNTQAIKMMIWMIC